jgi:pyruvate/2-oxoacid:ferredoxin oxidoreductase beta subunit
MQTRFLYYLIKLLVKSSKNKGLQVQDFIYVVFSSETFEDLFERTLRIATGIEVSQLEIDEIDFPNKRSRVKFMKCIRRIREKKIVSKVDGWGQAIT